MPDRVTTILESAFCKLIEEADGKVRYVIPPIGEYPNRRQVQRVLGGSKTLLERAIEKTTARHFEANRRGYSGRNWQGVGGPGHQWAIDSTVGKVFLRSSVNRAWIIGRPIVYVIVDVWSTAIVGFHVCLSGPRWEEARAALFNAVAGPLFATTWGLDVPQPVLFPEPTLCFNLLCDRGEYLSKSHKVLALELLPMTSYTPPYRGDLKGMVEVLHRIVKDKQYSFVPGAMDIRRAEMEKKKLNPALSKYTLQEYVAYLKIIFDLYNATANREKRLDAGMIADGVVPTPAGLWRWGHETGIGLTRTIPQSELIRKLLVPTDVSVLRDRVRQGGCDYEAKEVDEAKWTTLARNFGSWTVSGFRYPGPMSKIWIPFDPKVDELLQLNLVDESLVAEGTTYDEFADAHAVQVAARPSQEHRAVTTEVDAKRRVDELTKKATALTNEAEAKAAGTKKPSFQEARRSEANPAARKSVSPKSPSVPDTLATEEGFAKMMSGIIARLK
ncbi:DDE-type integrase/transposase/recombinase [Variovorax sp. YR216]|uniref:DDE-type integrase/transposase/recombinase n=1 Tax=Variovorax sp. YR216 TaxID=1882828 RepID=UPI000894709A|nr:DDE-type integrase/transposase/recombinase [Variovorax sp. YR216]SEB19865.1 Integrase core domain-containing protein [Variovorax sp. YR216]